VGPVYGFGEPLVVGDAALDCAAFGVTSLPATPIAISRTVMTAATTPNVKTDLLPPFEPSSMSAMSTSPNPAAGSDGRGLKGIKKREGAEGRDIGIS
jgi:hypothetical protein